MTKPVAKTSDICSSKGAYRSRPIPPPSLALVFFWLSKLTAGWVVLAYGIFNKGFVRAYARTVGLDEGQAVRLVRDCHALLAPGGELYGGSVTSKVPAAEQILREWLSGSALQYRDEASWRQIFAKAGFTTPALHFAYERYRANVIIRATKEADSV